jgi:small redox-active disulfide protein 2
MEIKVLGPGWPRCRKTEEIVLEAVREAGVEAEVTKVKDTMEIARAGVFMTPAVMVNGEVKCVGKVPGKEEVVKWITT